MKNIPGRADQYMSQKYPGFKLRQIYSTEQKYRIQQQWKSGTLLLYVY